MPVNLNHGDLEGTISNYISIDEYKPKTGQPENIIVLAFFTYYEDAAKDLKSFIEFGVYNIADVEYDLVPHETEKFNVFVEIPRDEDALKTIFNVIQDVENLEEKSNWRFSIYMEKGIHELTPEKLKELLIDNPTEYNTKASKHEKKKKKQKQKEDIKNKLQKFLERSFYNKFEYNYQHNAVILQWDNYKAMLELVGIENREAVEQELKSKSYKEGLYNIDNKNLELLVRGFSNNYKVYNFSDVIFVVPQYEGEENILMLREYR